MDGYETSRGGLERRHTARIVVKGEFGPLLSEVLPECEIAALSGETHITALVRDQAEMFGLIERVRNLGAVLVSASVDP